MKFILLALALLCYQGAFAADKNKEKADKSEAKADKTEVVADSSKVVKPKILNTDIIPQPRSLVKNEGYFTVDERTTIVCGKGLEKAGDYLRIYIPTERKIGKKSNSIRLHIDDALGEEAYTLSVSEKGVEIRGGDYGGVFNAIQTLLQLLPPRVYNKGSHLPMEMAYVEIEDAPQYHYRGYLLDVSRTFVPTHEVKRLLDYMAFCKLNKFHFHLVDDTGWRIEIKSHPRLAQVGGFRGGDSPNHPIFGSFNKRYGGYYTQEELREIVEYAAVRNIEVIPEIDMPGHSQTLGVVYPQILCNYTPDTSKSNGIDIRNVWCVAKQSNYTLIEDIIKEVAEIFPSKYIHIGGDEVRYAIWMQCPDCQRLMREKGIKDGPQLEQHFISRVSDILSKYDRKAVVWDEAVDGGKLPTTTLVTGWRGVKECLESTAKGYPTIVMPWQIFYLDRQQSKHERGGKNRIVTEGVSLKTICDFSLDKAGFSAEQRKNIAGIEGAFWTELYLAEINSRRHFTDYLEYMTFPRLFCIAEVAWSRERRSYEELDKIIKQSFYPKLHAMSATFRLDTPTVKVEKGKIFVTTEDGSKIYYTDIRNNKTFEYRTPLNSNMAPYVTFHSQLMTGYSKEVGAPAFYESKHPKLKITSSMPFSESYPVERCELYKHNTRTARAAKKGDWIEFRFEQPLKCSYIKLQTGYDHMQRYLIYKGHVEVCYDGTQFVRAGNFNSGYYILRPKNKPIYAIRLVADHMSDAEERVTIQPLIIK